MGSYKSSLPLELLVFHKQGDNQFMQLVQPDSDNHTLSPLTYALKRHTTPLGTDFHPLHKSFTSFSRSYSRYCCSISGPETVVEELFCTA